MHELSIAQGLMTDILSEMKNHQVERVCKVGLSVGRLSGVVPDALRFCFEAITRETPLEGTELDIDWSNPSASCCDCGHVFPVESLICTCPICDSPSLTVEGGRDLTMTCLEVPE